MRFGLVNLKLLFVCLIIAGAGVWYFYLREGSSGVSDINDLSKINVPKIENPFNENKPKAGDVPDGDPFNGPQAIAPVAGKQPDSSKLIRPELPQINPSDPKITQPPPPRKSPSPSPREAALEGRWLAKWSANGHDFTTEWDLKASGTATARKTQNGNPIGRFPFKWYVADDLLLTEMGSSKAQFRYRAVDANTFELTILSGVNVAPGQSRIMTFQRVN